MLVPGGLQFLFISTCFAWRPVTNVSKSLVFINSTCARGINALLSCMINKWLLISHGTGIYAIILIHFISCSSTLTTVASKDRRVHEVAREIFIYMYMSPLFIHESHDMNRQKIYCDVASGVAVIMKSRNND